MARIPATERRQALVDAAIRVMTREGLAAATVRAIVAEAGTHVATFHYCFDSKDDLLREVMRALATHNEEVVLSAVSPGMEVEAALRDGLLAYWADVEANPGVHGVTYELTQYFLHMDGLEHLAGEQYEQYYSVAEAFLLAIEDAAGVRWFAPMPVLSRMVVTILDGLTLNWLVDRKDDVARASLDSFATSLSVLASAPTDDATLTRSGTAVATN